MSCFSSKDWKGGWFFESSENRCEVEEKNSNRGIWNKEQLDCHIKNNELFCSNELIEKKFLPLQTAEISGRNECKRSVASKARKAKKTGWWGSLLQETQKAIGL